VLDPPKDGAGASLSITLPAEAPVES